jgi:DNA-binding transcriptional LysR family regulator
MITHLRSFLAVVEEGSLHRAAARLRLSQPALSRQMQALEHEVGGKLLERSSTGVSPTAAGYALVEKMRPILARYDEALGEVRRLARGESAQVRIGYLGSIGQDYLKPALAAFRKAHPTVKVKLRDLSPGEQITALHEGAIDLAVTGQEGSSLGRDFYARKLATLPLLAVLPAEHRLASRPQIALGELRSERFVGTPESELPGRTRWLTRLCRQCGGFRPKFIQEADSLAQAFELVVNEEAVALVPGYLRRYPSAGVAMVPVSDAAATWDFFVAWQRGRTGPALRTLLEALSAAAKAAGAIQGAPNHRLGRHGAGQQATTVRSDDKSAAFGVRPRCP